MRDHHDQLSKLKSGTVCEFEDPEYEAMKGKVAGRLGYKLVGHRLELRGIPLKKS